MKSENIWNYYSKEDLELLNLVNDKYKDCLNKGKTERECVKVAISMAKENGYIDMDTIIDSNQTLDKGAKVYRTYKDKMIVLFNLGSKKLSKGMNILGAHIDSPRLDLKQNPLYESNNLAYFDTHYYGGIKKYQWVATPMAIHGVVCKKDGNVIDICIGEDENDPVFVFTDLLIHLAGQQMTKKASTVVEGEKLDLLIGNMPLSEDDYTSDSEKECIKANVLKILKDKYNFEEEDFLSAELEIVPSGKAKDLGLDRSMIISYGQDDRVCAFPSLFALLDVDILDKTGCCILVDKEEIGSVGATGMQSRFFENTVAELINLTSEDASNINVRRALSNSSMLSSDVTAGYDPLYADVYETRSSSFLASGLSFNKFTGSRGKSGSNDANGEYIAKLRKIMDENNVYYQFSELGKVDAGGGGTIAYIMANYGMEVIDSGVAVFNMHAPYEVTSKADIYEAYKGYKAFLKNM